MIVLKRWRRVERITPKTKGGEFKREHIYTGWFLFGVLPLFINRETTWTVAQ